MDLLWPGFLFVLVLVPLLVAAYIWLQRRRRPALRYSSLSLVHAALPRQSRLRRHLPFILLLLALASLSVAMARPVTVTSIPTDQTTIVLAIDVSRSMCSTDILPSRIEAAQAAALSFIKQQGATRFIGVVAFSGFAELVQAPTTDQSALAVAINSLATGRRTAIGSGILAAIDAIAEVDKNVAPSVSDISSGLEPPPVAKGAYAPDIIVLLTDGVSNTGPLPLDAAKQAADRGIRVYTIGFGTAGGMEFPRCPGQYLGSEPFGGGQGFGGGGNRGDPGGGGGGFGFGGGGFGGGGFRRGIDEATLKQVSALTGGVYYSAQSATDLQSVFRSLPTNLIVKHETSEVSVGFTALGALFAALAVLLGLLWHPLP
jgi:Ca-activated chloride channel family protein